jgi:uncharacterized glyoxalase superfamily protein PhnB
MSVSPIPEGYSRVSPFLICNNAEAVLNFIVKTFDAQPRGTMKTPEGKIGHSEVKIGDSVIMLSDGSPDYAPSPAVLHVYVENVDETFPKALASGGTVEREVQQTFYGDRNGAVKDPGGNTWWISTRVENVSPEEMERRMKEAKA